MGREENKVTYLRADIKVLRFSTYDVLTASDLFTDSDDKDGSVSSGSWT